MRTLLFNVQRPTSMSMFTLWFDPHVSFSNIQTRSTDDKWMNDAFLFRSFLWLQLSPPTRVVIKRETPIIMQRTVTCQSRIFFCALTLVVQRRSCLTLSSFSSASFVGLGSRKLVTTLPVSELPSPILYKPSPPTPPLALNIVVFVHHGSPSL